jgi:Protein of unknown function (DUF3140)
MSESQPTGSRTVPGTDIPLDAVPPATDPLPEGADLPGAPEGDLDDLWEAFHEAVNMTSRELEEWLRTESATPDAEVVPEQAGRGLGQHVVQLLGKRKVDVTAEDQQVMRQVVDTVRDRLGDTPEPTSGDAAWRHGLMDLGHDPLKPAR